MPFSHFRVEAHYDGFGTLFPGVDVYCPTLEEVMTLVDDLLGIDGRHAGLTGLTLIRIIPVDQD